MKENYKFVVGSASKDRNLDFNGIIIKRKQIVLYDYYSYGVGNTKVAKVTRLDNKGFNHFSGITAKNS